MRVCKNCGSVLPDGAIICEFCDESSNDTVKSNGIVPPRGIMAPPATDLLLQELVNLQKENRRMLKSISSSTAILAALALLELIVSFIIINHL